MSRKPDRTQAGTGTAPESGADFNNMVNQATDWSGRAVIILLAFFAVAVIFAGKLFYLQVVKADEYSQEAAKIRIGEPIETLPRRGVIYDRNGVIMAQSVDAVTVWANPDEIPEDMVEGVAAQLSFILGGDFEEYKRQLSLEDTYYAYIERQVDAELAEELEELGLKGIYFVDEARREYPCGQVGGQVIGFVNREGDARSGLELYHDEILRGVPGKLVVERGIGGIPIPGGIHMQTYSENGQDIVTSLDVVLQEKVEEALIHGVAVLEGTGGSAVVMDGATGEILACASLPLLNPSDLDSISADAMSLKCINEGFEPGSTFKAASMAAILEAGALSPDDKILCPAVLPANGYAVTDAWDRGDEVMNLWEILYRSSNVGISLSSQRLGFRHMYSKILDYNLNSATGVDYPGELEGYLLPEEEWSLIQAYNVSFGQGISVTPLQTARFYGALVNNGVECTPHFLVKELQNEVNTVYPTEQVIVNTEVIPILTDMLELVVTLGTASDIWIPGYSVAGKTGTSEIEDPVNGGYLEDIYNISFVGFLPYTDSSLVCFVAVTEVPGDRKATQIFQDIMTFAIDRYRIAPTEG